MERLYMSQNQKYIIPQLLIGAFFSACVFLFGIIGPLRIPHFAYTQVSSALITRGPWNMHAYDLLSVVAYSNPDLPNGPLVVYRATGTDLRANQPVLAVQRDQGIQTPQ